MNEIDEYLQALQASQNLYLILNADLTIVDARDAYRRATLLWREEIRGCEMFDVFPDNPGDAAADGVQNLRASFYKVFDRGRPHRMRLQRYAVRDQVSCDGAWVEKFWLPVNRPVFGGGGRRITHVIHQVEDVTEAVLQWQLLADQTAVLAEQRGTLKQMQEDLARRERDARAARRSLKAILRMGSGEEPPLEAIERQFGALDDPKYWGPGDRAPVTGLYDEFHQRACETARSLIFRLAGQVFPRCPICELGVYYRSRPVGRAW
jgi:hypothetical protein